MDPGGVLGSSDAVHCAAVAREHAVGTGAAPSNLVPTGREVQEAQRRLKHAETLISKFPRFRANDYAVEESDLRRSLILNTTEQQFKWDKVFSWFLSVVIGVLNGIAGFLFTQGINYLNQFKFDSAKRLIDRGATPGLTYLVFIGFAAAYSFCGAMLGSYVSPQAAGSGIPEIRCYLNGIHVRGLLTIRTFFAKAFGVVLSVASGLIVGKEGPFTHVGAILGGGVGHLGSTSLTRATNGYWRAALRTRFGGYFRSSVSHRDYVAAGAAAGVASAFNAPIGGILFSVEQGASFYNFNMLSHAFLAAGMAIYVSALLSAALAEDSALYRTAMSAKRTFVLLSEVPDDTRLWYYTWELPIFALMGLVGGLLGSGMVVLNNRVTAFRRRFIPATQPARRVAEVVLLAIITSTAWFLAAYLSPCGEWPPKYLEVGEGGSVEELRYLYPQLWCADGQYSEYGMLFFLPQMQSITMLFQYQMPNGASFIYNPGALATMFLLGWFFMSITFGIGAVTGLFVPSLRVGGAGGRLMGRLVRAVMLQMGVQVDGGGTVEGKIDICLSAYAVVGAGSVLGGVSRMLLCNTVLVMETAGATSLIMPLIVTTFIAKAVADLLTPRGIFDLALDRQGYPYLEAEPTDLTDIKLQQALTAGDVMSPNLVTLPAVVRIGDLVEALRRNQNFSTFPLTDASAAAANAPPQPQPPAPAPAQAGDPTDVSPSTVFTARGGAGDPDPRAPTYANNGANGAASPWSNTTSWTPHGRDRTASPENGFGGAPLGAQPSAKRRRGGGALPTQLRLSTTSFSSIIAGRPGGSLPPQRLAAARDGGSRAASSRAGPEDAASACRTVPATPTSPVGQGYESGTVAAAVGGGGGDGDGDGSGCAAADADQTSSGASEAPCQEASIGATVAPSMQHALQFPGDGPPFTDGPPGGAALSPQGTLPHAPSGGIPAPDPGSPSSSRSPRRSAAKGSSGGGGGSIGIGSSRRSPRGSARRGPLATADSTLPGAPSSWGPAVAGPGPQSFARSGVTSVCAASGAVMTSGWPASDKVGTAQGVGGMAAMMGPQPLYPYCQPGRMTFLSAFAAKEPAWAPAVGMSGPGGGTAGSAAPAAAPAPAESQRGPAFVPRLMTAPTDIRPTDTESATVPTSAAGMESAATGRRIPVMATLGGRGGDGVQLDGARSQAAARHGSLPGRPQPGRALAAAPCAQAPAPGNLAAGAANVAPPPASPPSLPPTQSRAAKRPSDTEPLLLDGQPSDLMSPRAGRPGPHGHTDGAAADFSSAAAASAAAEAAGAAADVPEQGLGPGLQPGCEPAGPVLAAPGGNGVIIGVISRRVLLKLLEMRLKMAAAMRSSSLATTSASGGDAAGVQAPATSGGLHGWLRQRRGGEMSRRRAERLLEAVDDYPVKAPSDRPGEEALFARLGPGDMDAHLDLRHYMQRVPYVVPATASLARTYRLFRGLGLHHIFVTAPSIPIIGLITRTDLAPASAYKVAYDLAQREQAQLQALLTAGGGAPQGKVLGAGGMGGAGGGAGAAGGCGTVAGAGADRGYPGRASVSMSAQQRKGGRWNGGNGWPGGHEAGSGREAGGGLAPGAEPRSSAWARQPRGAGPLEELSLPGGALTSQAPSATAGNAGEAQRSATDAASSATGRLLSHLGTTTSRAGPRDSVPVGGPEALTPAPSRGSARGLSTTSAPRPGVGTWSEVGQGSRSLQRPSHPGPLVGAAGKILGMSRLRDQASEDGSEQPGRGSRPGTDPGFELSTAGGLGGQPATAASAAGGTSRNGLRRRLNTSRRDEERERDSNASTATQMTAASGRHSGRFPALMPPGAAAAAAAPGAAPPQAWAVAMPFSNVLYGTGLVARRMTQAAVPTPATAVPPPAAAPSPPQSPRSPARGTAAAAIRTEGATPPASTATARSLRATAAAAADPAPRLASSLAPIVVQNLHGSVMITLADQDVEAPAEPPPRARHGDLDAPGQDEEGVGGGWGEAGSGDVPAVAAAAIGRIRATLQHAVHGLLALAPSQRPDSQPHPRMHVHAPMQEVELERPAACRHGEEDAAPGAGLEPDPQGLPEPPPPHLQHPDAWPAGTVPAALPEAAVPLPGAAPAWPVVALATAEDLMAATFMMPAPGLQQPHPAPPLPPPPAHVIYPLAEEPSEPGAVLPLQGLHGHHPQQQEQQQQPGWQAGDAAGIPESAAPTPQPRAASGLSGLRAEPSVGLEEGGADKPSLRGLSLAEGGREAEFGAGTGPDNDREAAAERGREEEADTSM